MQQTLSDVYTIPREHLDLCETIGQIAREQIAPRSAEIDEKAEYPWDIRKVLAEQDILGLPFPVEYGGTGTGTLMLNMAVEEIAKVDASCALILMVQELGTLPIQLFGSDDLKERFLPRCASGEWSPAFALSEPEAGSDPAGMKTTAVLDGDEWVINGTKNWISNLGVADFYICFAVTDRESKRITAFVVEADRPGFSVGKLEHKLGIRASPTGQPIFEDVRVPQENVIGEVGRGLSVALGTLERTRLGAAAQAVGIAQGATDYAVAYAKERVQFGKPIFDFQAIQFKIADMQTEDRGRPRAALQGMRDGRSVRSAGGALLLDGQGVLLGHRDGRDRGCGSGPGRLRLREGVSGGAHDAGRQDHPDLRGHERDPAARHCPHAEVGAMSRSRRTLPTGQLRRIGVAALIALSPRPDRDRAGPGLQRDRRGQGAGGGRARGDRAWCCSPAAWRSWPCAWGAGANPESETEFEEIVRHSEQLARENLVVDPDEAEFRSWTRSTTRTSRSSCGTRWTICPNCCATRCATSRS